MRITEHIEGHGYTICIEASAMGTTVKAQLSGMLRYALIDGLLWWVLCRKLDAFVASCLPLPIHASMVHAGALHEGERLVAYVHTTPWHESDGERATRIMRTLHHHLPELAPLAQTSAMHQTEHKELLALANLLHERLLHPGEASHGLQHILTNAAKAA